MKETFRLVATAAAGLEAVVGKEVRALGFDCQVENGKVYFEGDVEAIVKTNLWLRAADRIKIIVGQFPARTFEELFQGVFALDWENYLPLGAKFPCHQIVFVSRFFFLEFFWNFFALTTSCRFARAYRSRTNLITKHSSLDLFYQ